MRTLHTSHRTARRAFGMGAVAAISALTLAACSSGSPEPTSSASGAGAGGGSGETIELTFLNQSRGQEAVLNALAAQYTEETGVIITVDSPGPADYLPKLQAKAQSNSMPDMYSSFSATDMAPFYKAGWAMDLSEELDGGWKDDFTPAIIDMSTFAEGNNLGVDPGIYTVHWETQTYGFLVNPAISGISLEDLPTTTEDFIAALGNSTATAGPFTVAASLTPQLLQGLASNWLTDEEIAATFNGEASWESDAWRNAFQFLVDLKDAGVLMNDALPGGQDDNPNVETAYFTQTVGAIFDATPGVAVGLRTNPEFTEYTSLAMLEAPGATQDPRSPGVPGKGAVINPKGAHPEEALKFVKWLTAPEQQAVFASDALILPTNPELLASADVPTQLAGFASGVGTLQVMSATFTPDVKTAIVAEAQRVVLGEATIDEALANIQAAQDRTS